MKAIEKGHPMAASKAACNSPTDPYSPIPAVHGASDANATPSTVPGVQSAIPSTFQTAWEDFGSIGNFAPGVKSSIPQSWHGLDGVGQALSAALQVSQSL